MTRTWRFLVVATGALALALQPLAAAQTRAKSKVVVTKGGIVADDDEERGKGGYLGVVLREETENAEGGARIEEVVSGSPGEKAGLREGDIVVGFGQRVIRGPVALTERIRDTKPGDRVEIVVLRDGKKQTISIDVGARPKGRAVIVGPGDEEIVIPIPDTKELLENEKNARELEKSARELAAKSLELGRLKDLKELRLSIPRIRGLGAWGLGRPKLGVELVDTTAELREFFGAGRDAGVLVGKVLSGSAAEKAGLRVGDLIVSVDGEKVADAGELIDALSDKSGKSVDLELIRDRRPLHIKASLPEEEQEEHVGPRAFILEAPPEPPDPPSPAAAPPPSLSGLESI